MEPDDSLTPEHRALLQEVTWKNAIVARFERLEAQVEAIANVVCPTPKEETCRPTEPTQSATDPRASDPIQPSTAPASRATPSVASTDAAFVVGPAASATITDQTQPAPPQALADLVAASERDEWKRCVASWREAAENLDRKLIEARADAAKSRAECDEARQQRDVEAGFVDRIRALLTTRYGIGGETIAGKEVDAEVWMYEVDQIRAAARKDRGDSDAG